MKGYLFFISEWFFNDGDYVFKDEEIGCIGVRDIREAKGWIKAPATGMFKKVVSLEKRLLNNEIICIIEDSTELEIYDTSYRIINDNASEDGRRIEYLTSGLNKLTYLISKDGFTNSLKIETKSLISLRSSNNDIEIWIKFEVKDEFVIYLEYYKKHFDVKQGDKIMFLLDTGEIVEIIFNEKSSRQRKESEGVIYAITEKLSKEQRTILSKHPINQWRIEFQNHQENVEGKIMNSFVLSKVGCQKLIMTSMICIEHTFNSVSN